MKLSSKLSLFIVGVLLVFSSAILLLISINSVIETNKEIITFREQEIDKSKKTLINYIDIAFEVITTNHANATDNSFLEKKYGRRLQDITVQEISTAMSKIVKIQYCYRYIISWFILLFITGLLIYCFNSRNMIIYLSLAQIVEYYDSLTSF
jgi:hypothetical protein